MKRLFTGIAVDAVQVPRLVEQASALRALHTDLRWSDRSGWHVTLQFYGMVGEARERQLREQLRTVKAGALEIVLRGMGTFERAGVLWVGVALRGDLEELQQRVVAAGEVCGFVREKRPYRPHMTLARRKGHGRQWNLKKSDVANVDLEFGAFRTGEFVLYESVTGSGGSRYEVIDRYPFKG